jgi:hypothetical protein
MEFPNFQISRPEFKELRRQPLSQHVYVDVALLDQSHITFHREVFQLNTQFLASIDQIDRLKQEIANLHRDSITFLGEAIEVNTEKKTILLKEGNLITYKYLIMLTAARAGDFNASLQTLKDVVLLEALNARAKIAEGKVISQTSFLCPPSSPSYSIANETSSDKLPSVAQKRIAESDQLQSPSQKALPKYLCQVKS